MLSGVHRLDERVGAGRSATQSNACPLMRSVGIVGPGREHDRRRPSSSLLLRRSVRPGSSVIVYAVFARKPRRGRTSMRLRCQLTRGAPSAARRGRSSSSSCAPVAAVVDRLVEVERRRACRVTFTAFGVGRDAHELRRRYDPPGRPAAGPPMRTPATQRSQRRSGAAAQTPRLVSRSCSRRARHSVALRALRLDDVRRRARDEAGILEPRLERRELLLELGELACAGARTPSRRRSARRAARSSSVPPARIDVRRRARRRALRRSVSAVRVEPRR